MQRGKSVFLITEFLVYKYTRNAENFNFNRSPTVCQSGDVPNFFFSVKSQTGLWARRSGWQLLSPVVRSADMNGCNQYNFIDVNSHGPQPASPCQSTGCQCPFCRTPGALQAQASVRERGHEAPVIPAPPRSVRRLLPLPLLSWASEQDFIPKQTFLPNKRHLVKGAVEL